MQTYGSKRQFVFIDGEEELILPVTPQSIEVASGVKIETVSITSLGDIHLATHRTLTDITITSFFPAKSYSFARADRRPYEYVQWFKRVIARKRPVRFIVLGTDINIAMLISEIRHGETDGPNDVNYTLTLSKYAALQTSGGTEPRPESGEENAPETYTVVHGDTLWSIARRFLGSGSRYMEIANANNMSDPNVLMVGQVLIIPRR